MAKNTRPLNQTISQFQPSIVTSWSFGAITSALRQHMAGDLTRSTQLWRSMGEDDEIPGDLDKIADSILKSPFDLECEDETIVEATPVKLIIPDRELKPLLKSKIMLGVAVGTLDWVKEDLWYPKLRYLDPEFLFQDTGSGAWKFQSRNGLIDVTPGDGVWFLHIDNTYGYFEGAVRYLAKLWYLKQATYRDWNRYNERHGLPIIKAKVPLTGHGSEKADFVNDIKEMGSEGVVGLPQDTNEFDSYDIDLLEPKDQSWGTFQAQIDRIDRKIQVALLGGNLSTEVATSGANRAAAETHSNQLDRIKAKAIAQRLSEDLQEQVFKRYLELNFKAGTTLYPCWQTEPPEDRGAAATAIKDFATGITALANAGFTATNLDEVSAQFGLELTYEKPPEPVVSASVPPGKKAKLSSGDTADGAIDGVLLADRIAEEVGAEAASIMRPDVRTLMTLVRSAESYPDLENRIRVAFSQFDPSALADLLQRGMQLAELDGRFAVVDDMAREEAR